MKTQQEKRLDFIREHYLVGDDEERLYRQNESILKEFAAVAAFGVKDPKESITLVEKYPGWIMSLDRFDNCAIIVADTVLWTLERENSPIYDEIAGARLPTIRDDVHAAIKKAFRATVEACRNMTDAEKGTRWTIPELLNVTFYKIPRL